VAGGDSWFVSNTTLLGQGGKPAPARAAGVVEATLGTYRGVGTGGGGGLPWSAGTAYPNRPGGGGGAAGYFVPGTGGGWWELVVPSGAGQGQGRAPGSRRGVHADVRRLCEGVWQGPKVYSRPQGGWYTGTSRG
jgi:hypothetical protein